MISIISLRWMLSIGLIISFYALPTPSKVYNHYSYHCIKNACLALIHENGDAREAMRYVKKLNTTIAYKVMQDLVNEGKVPKKYGFGSNY